MVALAWSAPTAFVLVIVVAAWTVVVFIGLLAAFGYPLFFPISDSGPAREQAAKAKAICATRRGRRECLAFALQTGQTYGIWGGTTEHEHERAAARRRTVSEQPVTDERRPA